MRSRKDLVSRRPEDGEPPTVALYLKDLRAGGAQRVFLNLCRGFLEAGLQVDMVLARGEGALLDQLPDGVQLVDLGARGALAAMPALRRYVRDRRPQALLASINYVNVTALLATRFLATPVFVREANILNENTFRPGKLHDRILLALMRLLYPRAERVIVNSEDTRASLVRYGVIAQDRIELIPNPVDLGRIRELAALAASHPWLAEAASPPVVLAVGSLSRQKNFDLLIRAFAKATTDAGDSSARDSSAGDNTTANARLHARLIILGEGEERSNLEHLANDLGVAERVSLPGFSDNPFSHMARADLFVLSSLWEGSANVLVEALACGAPVVATDCPGGAREVLGHEGLQPAGEAPYGTLVRSDDEAALAEAITRMIALPHPVLEELRIRSRQRAETYNLATVTDRYREMLGLDTTRIPPR
jgi:glycosyltransferase involved in cell wall biosynthesis